MLLYCSKRWRCRRKQKQIVSFLVELLFNGEVSIKFSSNTLNVIRIMKKHEAEERLVGYLRD